MEAVSPARSARPSASVAMCVAVRAMNVFWAAATIFVQPKSDAVQLRVAAGMDRSAKTAVVSLIAGRKCAAANIWISVAEQARFVSTTVALSTAERRRVVGRISITAAPMGKCVCVHDV